MRLVREILTDPRCWRRMTDDTAPAVRTFEPKPRPGIEYILARRGSDVLALFVLVRADLLGKGFTEVHFCFRPQAWGRETTSAIARAFVAWVWAETSINWMIGPVPAHNRLALRLAKEAGFTEFAQQPGCVAKGGKKYDRILLQIARPE